MGREQAGCREGIGVASDMERDSEAGVGTFSREAPERAAVGDRQCNGLERADTEVCPYISQPDLRRWNVVAAPWAHRGRSVCHNGSRVCGSCYNTGQEARFQDRVKESKHRLAGRLSDPKPIVWKVLRPFGKLRATWLAVGVAAGRV